MINTKAIVITGGPGMGKTSILEYLDRAGYACVAESGRHIIRHQIETGGSKLPWADREGYAIEMFHMAVRSHQLAAETGALTFFDRGLPDTVGYLRLCNLPVPDEIRLAVMRYRYCQTVFVTPPWPEIYVNDTERKQSFREAVATYDVMNEVYAGLGYDLVEIPHLPVPERADFILDYL
ncbi:AAA family ATPase [Ravibacter arvi]|uniref:AAA family ATPase n=1 Tax=Ravibacter arvi TaxID=2051041 RepID=A0ABP8M5H5_9BACT